ncbi:MAG: hypothetical protein U9R50_05255 [Campylobacterota bacterium]|nr:hypothetical protein [Campylobacterota bacterium]
MTKHFKTIIISSLLPLVLGATSLPQASEKPLLNLQHYIDYTFDGEIDITCKEKSALYICESYNQSISEIDDANVSSSASFKKMQIHFHTSLASHLKKELFEQTIQEMKESEIATQKALDSNNLMLIETPLEDALNRAIMGNLLHISLDGFDAKHSEPKSHISIKNITYTNSMKPTAKGVSFVEPIFGKIELRYTQALMDGNDSTPFYQKIPAMLEEWFETHNEKRASYVGQKLHELYVNEVISPVDGSVILSTQYLGKDAMSLTLEATNDNHKNTSGSFSFSGELRNISTLFQASKGTISAGMPDFLFNSLELHSFNKADNYRHLINNDKKLSKYVREYTKLIHEHFDEQVQAATSNAIVTQWFEEAKVAFTKIIQGEADKLDISISNKKGLSAMELFGIVMGRMMQAPKKGSQAPSQEDVAIDMATEYLELKIKAH